ncbi:PF08878 domain protein [Bordetella hinzii 1277]|nr:PF08878 domain protein [Bordetella hinzii 1277]
MHGLDGIHAKVENGALYVFFLESKLSQSANAGVKDYAESVAGFGNNLKQYLLEYSIVRDLGNLDSLAGEERDLALACFDVMDSPDAVERRERSVGVIVYKEGQFGKLTPVQPKQPVGFHEFEFAGAYAAQLDHHQQAALKHLSAGNVDCNKCHVYFVAVPDVDELREQFYIRMGYKPEVKK